MSNNLSQCGNISVMEWQSNEWSKSTGPGRTTKTDNGKDKRTSYIDDVDTLTVFKPTAALQLIKRDRINMCMLLGKGTLPQQVDSKTKDIKHRT